MKFEDYIKSTENTEKVEEVKAQTPVKSSPISENPAVKNKIEVQTEILPAVKKSETPLQDKNSLANFATLQKNLNNCLTIIDDEVMKGYLVGLDKLPIIETEPEQLKNLKSIYFFKITELVYQEDELSVSKLATLFKALSNKPCTLVLMIKSDGYTNEFYLGVRSMSAQNSTATMMNMLKQSMIGLFPGSHVEDYLDEDLKRDLNAMEIPCLSSVTCVADFRQRVDDLTDKRFIQGMEKFIESMHGRSYQAVFIAENIGHAELEQVKRNYENICTQISPFVNMQINFSMSESENRAQGKNIGVTAGTVDTATIGRNSGVTSGKSTNTAETFGRGVADTSGKSINISEGTAKTSGTSSGKNFSNTESNSENYGGNVGVVFAGINKGYAKTTSTTSGTSFSESQSNSISKTLSHGLNISHTENLNFSKTKGSTETHSINQGQSVTASHAVNESVNFVESLTLTNTLGSSRGISLNGKNITLQNIFNRLEKQLKRIEDCESFGMWNFAAYFIGESAAETESAANIYQSVISGNKSGVESSAINTWLNDEDLNKLKPYIKNFLHPKFSYEGFDYETRRDVEVTPAVMVSTNELSIHMGLPYRSVKGLPIIQHTPFAQEVLRHSKTEKEINLGNIYHLGDVTNTPVNLDLNSLTMHTFVTGSTGAGKSNAIYNLLSEVQKQDISFLVVEPAKGEYRKIFPNVNYFGTNPNLGDIVQINPFAFPQNVHVLEHIDRLVEIFNVCWPMYAAMPAVLKESIEKSYVTCGWDMAASVNKKFSRLFPTFDDVLINLNDTIYNSDYSADTKGDYVGALSTRIKSLTTGINGLIFTNNEMDLKELFDTSAILDISRVGSMETKSLIMGLIVLKLQEYRAANAVEFNAPLKHITVLEEAHNLLKKTSTEQSAESSNMQGKSVEMLTNTIAEIRTYGEGFIIVDQAPDLLDTAVIRNTNTKIVLRLPEGNDRKITGLAMALSDKQILEISKLPTGTAAVYQNDWQDAVLCKMPKFSPTSEINSQITKVNDIFSVRDKNDLILHTLLKDSLTDAEINKLKKDLLKINVSARIRRDLILGLEQSSFEFDWGMANFICKNYDLTNFFHGTSNGQWHNLSELSNIIFSNVKDEFQSFSRKEILKIMYYVCLIQEAKYPKVDVITQLRTKFLVKELTK